MMSVCPNCFGSTEDPSPPQRGRDRPNRSLGSLLLVVVLIGTPGCPGGGGGGGDDDNDGGPTDAGDDFSGGDGGGDVPEPEPHGTLAAFEVGDATPVTLSLTSVDVVGATIAVADDASPLAGLTIVVPPNATDEPITFAISYADVESVSGLPDGTFVSGRMIQISTQGSDAWNRYQLFHRPVRVTLPYDEPAESEDTIRYYFHNADDTLDAEGFEAIDREANTITFLTRTFADPPRSEVDPTDVGGLRSQPLRASFGFYVALGIQLAELAELTNGAIDNDSTFRPSVNGFYIDNQGSYYDTAHNGHCFGMVEFAKYYFVQGHSPNLFSAYRDERNTETWQDDAVAIQIASRGQFQLSQMWEEIATEVNEQIPSSRDVALSIAAAIYVTREPAIIGMHEVGTNPQGASAILAAHAIMAYAVDHLADGSMTFQVYDPNWPGDDTRRVAYTTTTRFSTYESGVDAASSKHHYNLFRHVGYRVGLPDVFLEELRDSANRGFSDDSVFPTITLTGITGYSNGENAMANEGTSTGGQPKLITADNAVVIQGTVLGGLAQDACCLVDSISVHTATGRYSAYVNNGVDSGDGAFELVIPLVAGENLLDFYAISGSDLFAAFHYQVIESTHAPLAMEVTLSWEGPADLDLYVFEPPDPDGDPGGARVSFQDDTRVGESSSFPYIVTSTDGSAPERYIGQLGMHTLFSDGTENPDGLYGPYHGNVWYMADYDDDMESIQIVPYTVTWRYLSYCADPCTNPAQDGIWVEGRTEGILGTDVPPEITAGNYNCCFLEASPPFYIDFYDEDFFLPDSQAVMPP